MKDSILKNINKNYFSSFTEKREKDKKNSNNTIKNNKKEIKFLSWDDRNQSLKIIINQKEITIITPQKNLSSKYEAKHVVYIFIDDHSAWVEVDFGAQSILNDIPSLQVNSWNKSTLSYLKHWMCKVFDELYIQQSDKIIVKSKGSWRSKIEEK